MAAVLILAALAGLPATSWAAAADHRGCDFDGDGYDDLVIRVPGDDALHVLFGANMYLVSYNSSFLSGYDGRGTCGDFDGDGKDSLVVEGDASAIFLRYWGAGLWWGLWDVGQVMTPLVPQSWSYAGQYLVSGDYNGDGADDVMMSVPGYDLPGIEDAGGVWELYGGPGVGLDDSYSILWHQDVWGVHDEAEAWDYFGVGR